MPAPKRNAFLQAQRRKRRFDRLKAAPKTIHEIPSEMGYLPEMHLVARLTKKSWDAEVKKRLAKLSVHDAFKKMGEKRLREMVLRDMKREWGEPK